MASSRGKPAYAAIMLALTLVIMAAIVGLLILMLYLCTNIAYKFIPAKTKKKVKRMFTRKKDNQSADDEPGIKRGRSVVEAGLSFRDTVLDFFFLREPGDRETVTLLMRGMPIPATYGFPDTDGTMKANAFEFVKQFHPSISICYVHPLHPFTARERFIVYMCTVAFNFVWTAAEIYCYAKGWFKAPSSFGPLILLCKYVATMLYAVLIRQICICPCAIMPVIKAAQPAAAEDIDDKQLGKMAEKAVRWKLRGDRALVQTYVIHLFYVLAALIFVARYPSWSKKALSSQTSTRAFPVTNPWEFMAVSICVEITSTPSTEVHPTHWLIPHRFIKFLPLFIILFPIHKAMWFEEKDFDGPIPAGAGAGGNLFDYLLCRKSCRYPGGYVKDDRPRCVQPETHNISRPSIRNIVDVFHAEGFSTMRRFDSTFGTTDPHEAFKPPVDDAPAEPEPEREEAGDAVVDDAPAADEASSGP